MNSNKMFKIISPKDIEYNLIHTKQIVFEITDKCNLSCKYCGYADLYEGYDVRKGKELPFEKAKLLVDYLYSLWEQNRVNGVIEPVTIGFYGGEPLLNVNFMHQIISYIEKQDFVGKVFSYNMTTNAMMLNKYMDFIVENEMQLLISLDGNETGQSYRTDHHGKNSFNRVFSNIQLLKQKHPDYFEKYVQFNSVLHNRNSVEEIFYFFKKNFNKTPMITSLNTGGIKDEKREEFSKMYKNVRDSLTKTDKREAIEFEMFTKSPVINDIAHYIHFCNNNVFETYNDLFFNSHKHAIIPTGTCIPFSKKIFLTVNGKILPCERISQDFYLGFIDNNSIFFDYEYIAKKHNELVSKYIKQCTKCELNSNCRQCIYNIDKNESNCPSFQDKKHNLKINQEYTNYLRRYPHLYNRLLKEVTIKR